MKKTLTIIAFVLATFQLYSQDKGFAGVTFGLSSPLNDFAIKDVNNDKAGIAKMGYNVGLSGSYLFSKYLGVAALFRFQSNSQDEQTYKDFMNNISAPPSGVSYAVAAKDWNIYSYMAGLYVSYPLTRKLCIESKVLFGLSSSSFPETQISVSSVSAKTEIMKFTSTNSSAFSNLLNLGIKYSLDDKLRLLAHIDYWSFKPEFTRTATIQSSTPTTYETKSSPSLNTINFNVGLGYSF